MNDKISGFYERITPESSNEEFLNTILRKAEKMNTEKKRISFKKPMVAIGAAAAAVAVGITAGAATGLIDFNRIFGGNITTDNSELGESLVSEMADFRYEVSDEDYIIVPKGTTGTSKTLCISFDIERVDGKPVSDFFLTSAETNELDTTLGFSAPQLIEDRVSFSSGIDDFSISVNEEGNLSVTIMQTYSIDIAGQTIRIMGSNLYERDELTRFREEQNVFDHFYEAEGLVYEAKGLVYDSDFFRDEDFQPVEVDESELILHELDWGIEFVYTPTQTAAETVSATDTTEHYIAEARIYENDTTSTTTTTEIDVTGIEAGSTELYIYYLYLDETIEEQENDNKIFVSDPNVTVQMADGRNITACFDLGTGHLIDGRWNRMTAMYYSDGSGRIALNINDIVSVTVNGVVYPLG